MNELLSDYLLGELALSERAAFEAELARDPALAGEAERLRPIVRRLDALDEAAWNPPRAPALALTARSAAAAVREPRRRRRRLTLRPLVAAALAAVVLGVGLGAGLLLGGGGGDGVVSGRVVVLKTVSPDIGAARGTAVIAADDQRATIKVRGLRPSAGGDFYELWLMNSADDLVSLGSFRVPASGDADVTVPLPVNPKRFAALDISAEPPDGNPAHSSRSVLRAPLSASS